MPFDGLCAASSGVFTENGYLCLITFAARWTSLRLFYIFLSPGVVYAAPFFLRVIIQIILAFFATVYALKLTAMLFTLLQITGTGLKPPLLDEMIKDYGPNLGHVLSFIILIIIFQHYWFHKLSKAKNEEIKRLVEYDAIKSSIHKLNLPSHFLNIRFRKILSNPGENSFAES